MGYVVQCTAMFGVVVLEDIILKGAKPATQSSLYPSNHTLIKEEVGHAHTDCRNIHHNGCETFPQNFSESVTTLNLPVLP